jgi:hypothetical protein
VELAANPAVLALDEPTSGLDARAGGLLVPVTLLLALSPAVPVAVQSFLLLPDGLVALVPALPPPACAAAIVMRAVRNTVDTGRTVVCTIHQVCLR